MRLTLLALAIFATTLLSAQLEVAADAPVLAYQAETKTTPSSYDFSNRRERTLLGDLDLSGAWGGPTYNYTATGNDFALVRGGFGGLEFGEEVFLGYGGWKAREDFTIDDPIEGSPKFNFKHSGFIFAYAPFADNSIHPRITTIIGPGRIEIEGGESDRMLVGQAMLGLELNLFQWFRLGIDGGYRFANGIDLGDITDQDVSGAVVQLEARFGFSW
ncbi:MAG: hypothetical protein ACJAZ9_000468 [Neolewinella sp.]|jgi:hypothetical protein